MTKEELQATLESGKKPAQIAREIGVSPQTVLNWMNKWGLRRLKDKLTVKFLKKRLQDGCSKEQISEELCLDISTINRFIRNKRLKLDICAYCEKRFHAQKVSVKCCSMKCLAWSHVDKRGPDDCWLYKGNSIVNGYGRIWNGLGHVVAHVVIWNILRPNDIIPPGYELRHKCKDDHGRPNRLCCNPNHLKRGTRYDNIDDAKEDGTFVPPPSGDSHKISYEDKCIIKFLAKRGWGCKKIQLTYFHLIHYTTINRHMKKLKKKS